VGKVGQLLFDARLVQRLRRVGRDALFTAEGATQAGLGASAPMCRICMQIFTSASAACTASVISRC
jgi:hypothetical protein